MPIPLIVAGVAAAGAIGGGLISSSATKKAAQASQDSTNAQIAASNANRDYQYNLNQPAIAGGSAADERISALLGLGGDATAANSAFEAYRGSTGYDFRTAQGEGAINSNAYARGMGNSGATLKALTRYGQGVASQEFGNYLGQLGGVSSTGAQARGLVAGVGNNATNTQAQALAANGANQGNALIAGAQNTNNMIGGLIQAGGYALGGNNGRLGSSYAPQTGGAAAMFNPPTNEDFLRRYGVVGYGG